MEEIVTVDGRQFKLTIDRPLTSMERQQVIADIRKQTGCSTCGPARMANMGNDWQYGGIRSLASCPGGTKASGDTISLQTGPTGGVGPYYVRYFRKPNASGVMTYGEIGTVRGPIAEGSTTGDSFTLNDTDVRTATGDTTAGTPTTDTTGAITEPGGGGAAIANAKIRVATTTYDSCPTSPQFCVEYCDINLACVAPTCNFVVT